MKRHSGVMSRRRALKTISAGGVVVLAGCSSVEGGDADPDPEPEPEPNLISTDPSPTGQSLSNDDIQALVDIFDDQPMNGAQLNSPSGEYTPRHVWKWVTNESFIALHFNNPEPRDGTELDYVVVGRKGLFTEESKPGPEFSHFHQHTAESWEAGHGGSGGEEGYWLTHMAVREIDYPFHQEPIGPRVDYDFFPTPVPDGHEEGHRTDFDSPDGDEGSLTAADRDALLEVFTDRTMNREQRNSPSGEHTPRHVWKWVSEDTFMFLHFNDPEPSEATELDYFGIGVRAQFTENDRPVDTRDRDDFDDLDPDFSHFHKHDAESWEAGHGAQDPDQWGYWLLHHAVRPVEYPFHEEPTDINLDRGFFPTPLQ
jgi:hypothetical protein